MRFRVSYLYCMLAIAFAVAVGVRIGPYWIDDALTLAAVACAITAFYLTKSEETRSANPETGNRMPRSRILHFVLLSRIRTSASMVRESSDPFRHALLNEKDWQTLSTEELKRLGRRPDLPDGDSS
jgi:hypothetical protein